MERAEQSDHTVRSCRGPAGGFGASSVCVERRPGWDVPGKKSVMITAGIPDRTDWNVGVLARLWAGGVLLFFTAAVIGASGCNN